MHNKLRSAPAKLNVKLCMFPNNIETINIDNFESIVGKGIKASINNDLFLLGNEKLMKEREVQDR